MSPEAVHQFILMIVPLLVGVTLHELAHGWVADRMGDGTARLAGRLTLNPVRHLHPVGSVLIPAVLFLSKAPFLFGYARPVPVNIENMRRRRLGTLLVSLAGVTANLACAVVSGLIFQGIIFAEPSWAGTTYAPAVREVLQLLAYSVVINVVLFVFNLLPVPPLDGSRVVSLLLPPSLKRVYARLEPFGLLIIILLLVTDSLGRITSFLINPLLDLFLGG